MIIKKKFDQKALEAIARESGSKQAVKDVSYARFAFYHSNPSKHYCEYIEGVSFILGKYTQDGFAMIGMATAEQHKRQGHASNLLLRLLCKCSEKGIKKIKTRTLSGVEFYRGHGFRIVGQREGDYLMELNL